MRKADESTAREWGSDAIALLPMATFSPVFHHQVLKRPPGAHATKDFHEPVPSPRLFRHHL